MDTFATDAGNAGVDLSYPLHTTNFGVAGMTCGHCVRSVKEQLSKLDGVIDVSVALKRGAVQVTSTAELDPAALKDAVEEAGYEFVG